MSYFAPRVWHLIGNVFNDLQTLRLLLDERPDVGDAPRLPYHFRKANQRPLLRVRDGDYQHLSFRINGTQSQFAAATQKSLDLYWMLL